MSDEDVFDPEEPEGGAQTVEEVVRSLHVDPADQEEVDPGELEDIDEADADEA